MCIQRIEMTEKLSRVVVHANVAYFSGLTAADRGQDTAGQTRQVLERADRFLNQIGADRSTILSATIWLRDIADFDRMNAVWMDWIVKEAPPARATVQAVLGLPDIAIEIQFTVAIPS
ncbi:enamine deaminase RidA (YjgF/YER057c/UK114 family) [Hoeflea marina]|uniref:Enamine deaminase RidA (YjgF/YER057c/UK114 family) n=1 Tax=Hoeflea marina TaxID=274592 RepID=A0A317PMG0_9HYPH|nr:RidA family protein [Hoeflea marina]PWW01946.1 enamine deaminase RidA (YjgF/YER057c/UK114 family) [Hoeflea marina]